MYRRRVVTALAVATLFSVTSQPASAQTPGSTLIRNALIADGRGGAPYRGAVRVRGDRVVAVGQLRAVPREAVVDARGMMLSPGFVDTHSHHSRRLWNHRDALAMVSQGITTIVVGQDGGGIRLSEFFAKLDSAPAAVNVASYVGHGDVRDSVLGADFRRVATAAEVARMETLVRHEMEAGALGLSTGLEYDPGIYSSVGEVQQLARVAAGFGGRYISHIRSEDRDFWPALHEAIDIGRVTGMPVQISHIKLGMLALWGQADSVVRVLNAARAAGVKLTADLYPYTYWGSNFGVFYPKRNFSDSTETAFILSSLTPPDGILFNSIPRHPQFAGKSLADAAAARGETPLRTMMALLAEPDGPDISIAARGMSETDIATLVRWPFTNICSDGASEGLHPRGFGSFPRVLGNFVREQRLFPVQEAVRKMTSLAAANVGIRRRGVIARGYFADLVLFDPATVIDRATFQSPQAVATGIHTVWVNGQVVFANGSTTSRYAGRALRREP
jgi:N-acyl-D-amino-acid deacylase